MSDGTEISWTDATVNAVNGCSVLTPGCTNCYAMRLAGTRLKHHPSRKGLTVDTKAGPVWNGEVRLHEPALLQPLRWRRPRRIFWNAHGDLFHDNVPDEWIDRCFAVMVATPGHSHQVLTKRSARLRSYMEQSTAPGRIFGQLGRLGLRAADYSDAATLLYDWGRLAHIWLGVSVEDQTRADERIPDLLATPAAVRFISAEPLLGPIDLLRLNPPDHRHERTCSYVTTDGPAGCNCQAGRGGLDWVIAGGESGPGARDMDPAWARSLRDQCAAAGVAFHMKQMAKRAPIPADLLVREYPA